MTQGQDGEKPEFYDIVKASQFYHMNPDDVIRLPVYWIEAAGIVSEAENRVREKRDQLVQKRKKPNGR